MSELPFTNSEYIEEIESLAKNAVEEAKEYDRDIEDVLHEMIDGHSYVIYTHKAIAVLYYTDNRDYVFEELGVDGINMQMPWSSMAYWAMLADVREEIPDDWDEDDDDDDDF